MPASGAPPITTPSDAAGSGEPARRAAGTAALLALALGAFAVGTTEVVIAGLLPGTGRWPG
ncbi:hypothetical protein [Streptomyces youssoufiensis]